MAGKNTAAFGLYNSQAQAENGVDALRAAGFRSDDISVLMPDRQSSEEFAHEKNTKAPEGTTTGVATGGAIGGTHPAENLASFDGIAFIDGELFDASGNGRLNFDPIQRENLAGGLHRAQPGADLCCQLLGITRTHSVEAEILVRQQLVLVHRRADLLAQVHVVADQLVQGPQA